MTGTGIGLHVDGPIATLRIENPPLNILTVALRETLFARLAKIEGRPEIRVVVLEAAGDRAFSVGSDIGEFPADELGGVAKIRFEQYLLDRLAALPAVTIAKVAGLALGGGAELMLACDFRIAASDAKIGFPEIRLGALPAAGGMKRLVHEIGPLRARELVMLGQPIEAARAAELGLVNRVVPPAELDGSVLQLANDLAALPGQALVLAKRTIAAADPAGGIDTVEAEAFGALFRGTDLAEGLSAFLAKRPPSFNRPA
ncbi:enoyl-CoA hydratase-related protein [Rhizobiaceae bacterium BDR2-2]|uniref:Enoyl-CoA hydratase-related protein n=1 Tax=Ectorhizobium quercum TaxID=2965071 RepID=A0AAE3MZ79_9HYPH|nr:enoyl-CoA hydratase-related protein [Ectorhizobium quercum]MCX8997021.1 enoyl-CoA hydratase-related protein [Ectorhizobium quercum]